MNDDQGQNGFKEANGPMGLMRLMRPMGLMGLMELMGLMGLMGCSSSDEVPAPKPEEVVSGTPICFSGWQGEELDVTPAAGVKSATTAGMGAATAGMGATRAGGVGATRAEGLETKVTLFNVWGFKNMECNDQGKADPTDDVFGGLQTVIPCYDVTWTEGSAGSTTSNKNDWEYVKGEQTIKYWDWNAKAYRFFGATNWGGTPPATYEADKAYGASEVSGATYEISMLANCSGADDEEIATNMAKTPFFTHLWFSTGELPNYRDKQFGQPVQLEFLKPYSKVRFMFKYSYVSEGIKIKSKSFKPTDGSEIFRKGIFTVSYPLTGTGTSETFTVTPEHAVNYTLTAFTEEYIPEGTEKWYFVLPRPSQGSYTLSVRMNNDVVDRTTVVPAEYMTWLPGYSYTYIFKILEEGGVEIEMVQSAFTTWTEIEADHTVYNW